MHDMYWQVLLLDTGFLQLHGLFQVHGQLHELTMFCIDIIDMFSQGCYSWRSLILAGVPA